MQPLRFQKNQILKGLYYVSVFFLASGFSYVAFAYPPATTYAPGATLDPTCTPGSTNCTVSTTASSSGSDGYIQFSTSGSLASDSNFSWDNTNKRLGIGTSTPYASLSVAGQIVGSYFTGTSTTASTFGGSLAINGTATSTAHGGFDITAGCYAINGTCIGGGTSTTAAGGTGAIQFANGTSFAGDATNLFWNNTTKRLGVGNSTPSYTLDVNGDANIAAGSSYKYNGVNIANASTTLFNYFFGNAGNLTMTGSQNTGTGYQSLSAVTTGGLNVANGYRALFNNTTGNFNTAVGNEALWLNDTGSANTAVGNVALYSNTSGVDNTAVGHYALNSNSTGSSNTAVGRTALQSNSTGVENTVVGSRALYNNTTGSGNIALGYQSLFTSTSTDNITAIGYQALYSNTVTGTGNQAVGYQALYSNTTGTENTATGNGSLYANTTGISNVADGYWALRGNTTGYNNTAVGRMSLYTNSTGDSNTAVGHQAMLFNTTGAGNSAFGISALWSNSTGVNNTALGGGTLYYNVSGGFNTAVGAGAMRNNTASFNTGVGYQALTAITTGTQNVALGTYAGYGDSSGPDQHSVIDNQSTFLGYNSSRASTVASTTALTNATAIGYNAKVGASNSMVLGGTGADAVKVGIGTTTPSALLSLVGTSGSTNNLLTVASSTGSSLFSILSNGTLSVGSGADTNIFVNGGTSATTPLRNTGLGYQALTYLTTGATDNVALGYHALMGSSTALMTGANNFAAGLYAGESNTTGSDNVFIGYNTGASNTTGYGNLFSGHEAGLYSTTGNNNSFIGYLAGRYNTTGSNNLFFGFASGYTNTTGSGNAFIGSRAGSGNNTGFDNVALGQDALYSNSTGFSNIAIGTSTLYSMTGSNNLGLGARAGYNSTGNGNVFLGYQVASTTTTGNNNIALGYDVQLPSTTGSNQLNIGSLLYGTGLGTSTLSTTGKIGIGTSAPTYTIDVNGDANIAAGSSYKYNGVNIANASTTLYNYFSGNAGNLTMTGTNNTATGYQALNGNTTGSYNTATGYGALNVNSTGSNNVAFGSQALSLNTTGGGNTAFGRAALHDNVSGVGNVSVGFQSLYVSSSNNNTALGYQAGYGTLADNRSVVDTYATFIGSNATRDAVVASTTVLTNITAIGKNATVGASNSMVLGGTGADAVKVGIGTTTPAQTLNVEQTTAGVVARFANSTGYCDINPTTTALVCTSDATLKKDVTTISGALDVITALRGVNFRWLSEDASTPEHLGVIAQEVEKVLPQLVANDDMTGKKSVNYIGFVPVLIEAVKNLADRVVALEAHLAQGISNVKDLIVETLTANKIATNTLEMKDSATGEVYCVKIANGEWDKTKGACSAANSQASVVGVTNTPTAPVEVIISGLNPQNVDLHTTWGDLGATASSTDSHLVNYGITTFVDGVQMATPSIDTATSSTHTINYKVIDGATGTVYAEATRIVNVVDPLASAAQ